MGVDYIRMVCVITARQSNGGLLRSQTHCQTAQTDCATQSLTISLAPNRTDNGTIF